MILAVCGSAPQLVGDGLVRTDIDPALGGGAHLLDLDSAHPALERGTDEIDVKQPAIEPGARHFDAFGQHERSLELAGGDPAMEVESFLVVGLLAADDELVVLDA